MELTNNFVTTTAATTKAAANSGINFGKMNGIKAMFVCISIQNKMLKRTDYNYCKKTFEAACNQAAATGACNKYTCENCPLNGAHKKALQRILGGKPIIID